MTIRLELHIGRSVLTGLQRCFLVCSLGVALGMRQTRAAEYHVSPSGNDGGDGAGAAPWKTIAHGVSQLKPGDTLTLHAGHYRPGEQITIRTPNTTVRGAPGEKAPLIDGTLVTKRDQGGKIQVILVAGDEVVLEGLEVANGKMHNIIISAKGVTVRNCHVHHTGDDVIRAYSSSRNWTIRDCHIHDGGGPNAKNAQGIDCFGWKGHIVGNRIHDCAGGILLKGGARDCVIERNILWNNTQKGWKGQPEISLGGSSGTWFKRPNAEAHEGNRLIARNNLIIVSPKGVAISFLEAIYCEAYNNTIIQEAGGWMPPIRVFGLLHTWDGVLAPSRGQGPDYTNNLHDGTVLTRNDSMYVTIRNNIVYSISPRAETPLLAVTPFCEKGISLSNNLWYRGTPGTLFEYGGKEYCDLGEFQETHRKLSWHSAVADPGFPPTVREIVGSAPPILKHFLLSETSPAVDAGATMAGVATQSQGNGFDLGAFESAHHSDELPPRRQEPRAAKTPVGKADVLLVRDLSFVTRQALDVAAVKYHLVSVLDLAKQDFAKYRVIIWGYCASRGQAGQLRYRFDDFLRNGGAVLAFAQPDTRLKQESWFPSPAVREASWVSHAVEKVHAPSHAALKKPFPLSLADLKQISPIRSGYHELGSGWTPILSGITCTGGYEQAPGQPHFGLIEYRLGKGKILVCALTPDAEWREDDYSPGADNPGRKLFLNLLHYAGLKEEDER
jgi:hypothetical protein